MRAGVSHETREMSCIGGALFVEMLRLSAAGGVQACEAIHAKSRRPVHAQ